MRVRRALFTLLFASSVASAAVAQPSSRRARRAAQVLPAGQLSLEEIAVMLSSASGDDVRMALEGAATLGSPEVVPLVQERVRAGLPPELLDVAMDSLVLLGDHNTGPLFAELARHRRPAVRLKAIQGLVTLRAAEAPSVLSRALSDGTAEVREAAAEGLGQLGARESIDRLFLAFDRNVQNAARALGRIANDDDVSRLLGYLGRAPFINLTPAFDALFARRDLPEATKLRVVSQLEELGTAEARGYLEGLRGRLSADTPLRVRRAIDAALGRIEK